MFTLELLIKQMAQFSPEARISILEMEYFEEEALNNSGWCAK